MLIWSAGVAFHLHYSASHHSPHKMSARSRLYCYGCHRYKRTKGKHFRKLENQSDSVKQKVEALQPPVEKGSLIPAKQSKVKWICGPCLQRFTEEPEKKGRQNPERYVKRKRDSFKGTVDQRVWYSWPFLSIFIALFFPLLLVGIEKVKTGQRKVSSSSGSSPNRKRQNQAGIEGIEGSQANKWSHSLGSGSERNYDSMMNWYFILTRLTTRRCML